MKIYTQVLSLMTLVGSTNAFAFSPVAPRRVGFQLHSENPYNVPAPVDYNNGAAPPSEPMMYQNSAGNAAGNGAPTPKSTAPQYENTAAGNAGQLKTMWDEQELFPIFPQLQLIQGTGTVSTFKMPPWTEQCQVYFATNGRPLKAKCELWVGPIRTTHVLRMDSENGSETPIQATLKFKKIAPVLRITTSESAELPMLAGVYVPSPAQSQMLLANTQAKWEAATPDQKQRIQGGSTSGGGGAIRYWTIPPEVDSVELIAWSKDVSKKSLRVNIEVLQGPNNIRQKYFLQCGGGTQPYHAVLQTPGNGCVIRMTNKKFLEDGLTEIAIIPYKRNDAPELIPMEGYDLSLSPEGPF